jgi:hypothetical protein
MNPYVAIVNQKISLCKILLSEGILKNKLLEKKTDIQIDLAFTQSAVYQLESAYISYLKEIAFAHKCKDVESIDSLQKLKVGLVSSNKSAGEAQEIELLLGEQQSWLSQILREHKKLSSPPLTISKKNNDHSISLLEVKQLDDIMSLNFGDVETWLNNFTEILVRNRQLMYEC